MQSISTIRFGFDDAGGFVVVDDAQRLGVYAYPTSGCIREARRDAERTARELIATAAPFYDWPEMASFYVKMVGKLDAIGGAS